MFYIAGLLLIGCCSTHAAAVFGHDNDQDGGATLDPDAIPGQLFEFGGHAHSVLDQMFDPDTRVELHLSWNDELFKMTVSLGHGLATTDTMLGIRTKNGCLHLPSDSNKNCFTSGRVHSHAGVVVFSHCGQNIEGILATPNHQYSLRIDKKAARQRRSVEEGLKVQVVKRSVGPSHIRDDIRAAGRKVKRQKRSEYTMLVIELGIWMDTYFSEGLEARGMLTADEKMDAILLLYSTESALLGMEEQLDYSIQLDVKYIEIWAENPDWYEVGLLSRSRVSFCNGLSQDDMLPDYDLKALHTMYDLSSNTKGSSWRTQTCNQQKNCYVVRTDILQAVHAVAHEIGHQLGMKHNSSSICHILDDTTGMMGNGQWIWSECQALVIAKKISHFPCLSETNVNEFSPSSLISETETLSTLLPGQKYSKEEACRMFAGQKAILYNDVRDSCNNLKCAAEKNGVRFFVKANMFLPGIYCGDGQICFRTTKAQDCHDLSETGIIHKEIVQGGWSRFGPWSECSHDCGTGITFRKRECSNPVPVNAPHCEGQSLDYALCNTEECDNEEAVDIPAIRITVCDALDESVETNGHGECNVACSGDTLALLPDGTPCSGTNTYCLEGQCLTFTSKWFITLITDAEPAKRGNRKKVFTIPAGTSSVDVSFPIQGDLVAGDYLFEIWNKENNDIVRPYSLGLTETGRNPINYAGTYWGYSENVVELYSEQNMALSEPVVVKLKKRTNKSFNNVVTVTYIQPLSDIDDQCTGNCNNGGTWDSTLCSCNCPSSYHGQTCNTNCATYCFNGYLPTDTTSSCTCDCSSVLTEGSQCQCKSQFTGRGCTECTDTNYSFDSNCQ